MLGILDDIEARQAEATGKFCKYALLLMQLSPEEQAALTAVHDKVRSDDPLFTVTWLVGTLNANQHPIGKTVVSQHLRGVCACE